MSSLRDGSGTSLSLHISLGTVRPSIPHRKVLRRIRISFWVQTCLSLFFVRTATQFQHAKAFLTPLSYSNTRNSRVEGRVIDDTAGILNPDSQSTSTLPHGAVDCLINISKHIGNHDEAAIEQCSNTPHHENSASNHATESSPNDDTVRTSISNPNELNPDPSRELRSRDSSAIITKSLQGHHQHPETTQPIVKRSRPPSGLSRTHQSLLSKTSHMRRQRFVTGKYPLYVEVKQNPTKKWLGLAESRIYLNG